MSDIMDPACPSTKHQLQSGEHVRGVNHTVVLKGRDDLFDPMTGDEIECDDGTRKPGLQLFVHNEVTAIPDNVGCCEIVSVGSEVQNVKPGDVVFIDFYDVRQGAIVGDPQTQKGRERYIANDDAFKAYFDPKTGTVTPMPGYVITKRANDRFKVALNGTDRVEVPLSTLTTGIVSGRTAQGTPAAFVIYEEVVSVAAPAFESKLRPMHRLERELLDQIARGRVGNGLMRQAYRRWRRAQELPSFDLKPGELVAFSTDFAVQIRVRGEFMRIVPQSALLCAIDDGKILDEAVRAGKAGKLQRPRKHKLLRSA